MHEHLTRVYDGAIFNRMGEAISWEQWVRLLGDESYVVLARDEVGGDVVVSTIWLGWSWESVQAKAPVAVFETAVLFEGDTVTHRYDTEADALAGHADAVKTLR